MLQLKRAQKRIENIKKVQEFVDLDRLDDYAHYQEIARKTDLSVGQVSKIIEDFKKETLYRKNNA
jgi:hypothetical protein